MDTDDEIPRNISTEAITKLIVRDAQCDLFPDTSYGLRYWIELLNSYIDPDEISELNEFCFNGYFVKDSSDETDYDVITYVELGGSGESSGWVASFSLFGKERIRIPWEEMKGAEDCNCVFITKEQANEIVKALKTLIDAISM